MTERAATSLPPGPRLPRRLQALALALVPRQFIEACHHRYGDLVLVRVPHESVVMVLDPRLVKPVFLAPPGQLRAGEASSGAARVLGPGSVAVLDGSEHIRHRQLLLPPLHGERMRAYEGIIREAADRAIESWPVGEPFSLLPSMRSLTLDVIVRAVLGIDGSHRAEELKRRLQRIVDPVSGRLRRLHSAGAKRSLYSAVAKRNLRRVDELVYEEITRRREAATNPGERQDILSMLLSAGDDGGPTMSDRGLRDELVTLLVGGHETTAPALAWAFELLLRNRQILERLSAELGAGNDGYLRAVVNETLRLRPLHPMGLTVRRLVREEPYELGGFTIPPGTVIQVPIGDIHRSPDAHPEPLVFRPERFLGDDAPDRSAWLPFGGGTRRCPGASFASFEMGVVIRRVLERARLEIAGGRLRKTVRNAIMLRTRVKGVRVVQLSAPKPAAYPPPR